MKTKIIGISNKRARPPKKTILSDNLCKSGPLHFGSENQFPSNFAHETILDQK